MKKILLFLLGVTLIMSCKKKEDMIAEDCMKTGSADPQIAQNLILGTWQLKSSQGWMYSEDVPLVVLTFEENKQVTVSKDNQVVYKGLYGIRESNQSLFLTDSSGKDQYGGTAYLTGQLKVCEQSLSIDQGSPADWPIYNYVRKDLLLN